MRFDSPPLLSCEDPATARPGAIRSDLSGDRWSRHCGPGKSPSRVGHQVDIDFLQPFIVQCCQVDDFSHRCCGSYQDVFIVAAVSDARWGGHQDPSVENGPQVTDQLNDHDGEIATVLCCLLLHRVTQHCNLFSESYAASYERGPPPGSNGIYRVGLGLCLCQRLIPRTKSGG
jgi:hypothetical protein